MSDFTKYVRDCNKQLRSVAGISWVVFAAAIISTVWSLLPFADVNVKGPRLPLPWVLTLYLIWLAIVAFWGGYRLNVRQDADFTKERQALAPIGGPELFIGFSQGREQWAPLVITNTKGGNAYNVILRVPEDGSKFSSKEINVLKDNGGLTAFEVGSTNKLDVADVIMAHAEELPFFVTCMDADCRLFSYRFSLMEGQNKATAGFKLEHKKCTGR
jgi:hypothetical protein